jgi:hypothetical protein
MKDAVPYLVIKGVHELWDRIEEQWARFTKDDCRKYIDSTPDRTKAVIQAKRGIYGLLIDIMEHPEKWSGCC